MNRSRSSLVALLAILGFAAGACGDSSDSSTTATEPVESAHSDAESSAPDEGSDSAPTEEAVAEAEAIAEPDGLTCKGDDRAVRSFTEAVHESPIWHQIDPLWPTEVEVLAQSGYDQMIFGTVAGIEPVGQVEIEDFVPGVEEATGNSVSWGGFVATVVDERGTKTAVPVMTIIGTSDVVARYSEAFEGDEEALVGTCVIVIAGRGATNPLEIGSPQILAVASSRDGSLVPFSYNFGTVVSEEATVTSFVAELAAAFE